LSRAERHTHPLPTEKATGLRTTNRAPLIAVAKTNEKEKDTERRLPNSPEGGKGRGREGEENSTALSPRAKGETGGRTNADAQAG
jgi:hypothetical protein